MSIFNPLNVDWNFDGNVNFTDDIISMNILNGDDSGNTVDDGFDENIQENEEEYDTTDVSYEQNTDTYNDEEINLNSSDDSDKIVVNLSSKDEHYNTSFSILLHPQQFKIDEINYNKINFLDRLMGKAKKLNSLKILPKIDMELFTVIVTFSLFFNFAHNCDAPLEEKINIYRFLVENYYIFDNINPVVSFVEKEYDEEKQREERNYVVSYLRIIYYIIQTANLDDDIMDYFGDVFSLSMHFERELTQHFQYCGIEGLSYKYAGFVFDEITQEAKDS